MTYVGAGRTLELLVLERAQVLHADLRRLLDLREVEALADAGLAQAELPISNTRRRLYARLEATGLRGRDSVQEAGEHPVREQRDPRGGAEADAERAEDAARADGAGPRGAAERALDRQPPAAGEQQREQRDQPGRRDRGDRLDQRDARDLLDAASAAGVTASATIATSTDRRACQFPGRRMALLLAVRATNGGGRDRAADHAGDRDQREDVGKALKGCPKRSRTQSGSRSARALEKPNSSAAAKAPNGLHLPKMSAASAMKPRPRSCSG